ncbi:MAG: HD-GYP domain-containing protein [Chloroflexi bacterium]|nr:MAG: HD-GYP domain-containing protein [Chloroflexota bacterium]
MPETPQPHVVPASGGEDGDQADQMLRQLLEQALRAAQLANQQAVKMAQDFAETYSREQKLARDLEAKVQELQLTQRQATVFAEDLAQMLRSERTRRRELERSMDQLRIANEELRRNGLQAISHLALAASIKDPGTGAHLQRVRRYVEAVAQHLGLPQEKVEELGYSSVMHDVGKIHTPDHILQSTDTLSPEQFEVIKQHCLDGERILGDGLFFETARAIAREHHERWDGRGYPSGLKGEAISLAARIVSVCDVFDALTSRRPYKEAWSVGDGMRTIVDGAGTRFDPVAVSALQALHERGLVEGIRAEVSDTAD